MKYIAVYKKNQFKAIEFDSKNRGEALKDAYDNCPYGFYLYDYYHALDYTPDGKNYPVPEKSEIEKELLDFQFEKFSQNEGQIMDEHFENKY